MARNEETEMELYLTISGPIGDLPVESLEALLRVPSDMKKLAQVPPLKENANYRNISVKITDGVLTGYNLVDFRLRNDSSGIADAVGERKYIISDLEGI